MPSRGWHRRVSVLMACAVGLTSALVGTDASAAQTTAALKVSVNLTKPGYGPTSVFCRLGPGPDTFGAVVTVVCATGALVSIEAPKWGPVHGGAYRYTHLAERVLSGLRFPGGIDIYTGVGTVTTWRIVNLSGWDYLEMQLAW